MHRWLILSKIHIKISHYETTLLILIKLGKYGPVEGSLQNCLATPTSIHDGYYCQELRFLQIARTSIFEGMSASNLN